MKRLENRVAIVTGGSNGIGKATCQKFATEGAKVIIWDLNEEAGNQLASEIDGAFQKVNTADYEAVGEATKAVIEKHGKIDILINNAGITRDATLKKMTPDQWQQVIDVNLTGVFNCGKHIQAHMTEAGYGRIVNTSSVVGIYGNFGQSNYVATKAGVIGLTKVWARELGRKGVTANAVAPGFIATDMVMAMPDNVIDMMKSKVPTGTLGKPEDIANAYCFLASEEAGYINGATISVDGGMTV
ncbi:beta-ketoacyl-ACP reductase [Ekhidna sp. MALMAid0563]|uniref:beta-ketoacyl-ACP reductase n=1 Tax=Ekhidna sp. MALMAid0563 TaxID=3143937 RepID=UPI0032DE5893